MEFKRGKNRMIYLIPTGGIGNRLRSIKSGIKLAKDTKQSLKIIWINTNDCPCDINDLIENIEGVGEYIEIKNLLSRGLKNSLKRMKLGDLLKSIFCRLFLRKILKEEKGIFIDENEAVKEKINSIFSEQLDEGVELYIRSYSDFYGNISYKEFTFRNDLMEKAKELLSGTFFNYIGIHIRQGDNLESIQYSPIKLFEEKMDNLLIENPQILFFSTEDKQVLQYFSNRYKEKCIYYYDKEWNRYTKKGQVDALVEMLCLSMTKKIYGSYYSSFSDIAANIGGIEKEIIRI